VFYTEGDLCDDQGFGGLAECSVFDDLICADGTCRRDGDGQLGSSCRSHLGVFTGVERRPCEPGAYCDGTARDGLCRSQKALGEMCTSLGECVAGGCNGFWIEGSTSTDYYCEW